MGWDDNENGKIIYDPKITNQKDLINGTYKSQTSLGITNDGYFW